MSDILPGYDRVTSVISFASGLSSVPDHILQNAADRGTRVHNCIDGIIKDLGEFCEQDIQGYVDSFKLWAEGKDLIPSQCRLYCDEYMITGEIDAMYKDSTGFVIVDFKTPLKESKTWNLQASAYKYLVYINQVGLTKEEKKHIKKYIQAIRIVFVKLDKFGKYPVIYEYEYNFDLFKSYLDVYRNSFKNGKEDINLEDL